MKQVVGKNVTPNGKILINERRVEQCNEMFQCIAFAISSASLCITGTTTLLPACLYNLVSLVSLGSLKSFGKPCIAKHSYGVSFLMRLSAVKTNGTLCPPVPILAVRVGHILLLFSLTYFNS